MTTRRFPSLEEVQSYLHERGVTIFGVEIMDSALPVHTHPFDGPAAFLAGNEGKGLSDAQKAICDKFVYISQYANGTASLNVTVAMSIILHNFAVWAKYEERAREGEKYVVRRYVAADVVRHDS